MSGACGQDGRAKVRMAEDCANRVVAMRTRIRLGCFSFFLGSCWGREAPCDDRILWRSWGVRDGFTETYSYAMSVTPEGNAYVRTAQS